MLNGAGADPLALYIHTRTPASDDRLPCLKNPRPEGAESSLTESASSPFQAEPAHLARGAIVPRHSHVSEQFSLILSGALKFTFEDGDVVVRGGEMIFIPSNAPHAAEALEDTVDLDIFSPRREDWIRKGDAYLRG